ncbi:MAG TPA: ATP-binding protein, partial [Thermomonospora sp.]|nr:ATP-binding protein [Thermomonospora sp.]
MIDVREPERRRILAALDTLGDGRTQVVEVVGEPGMGKTWLLATLAEVASSRGMVVLSNRCTESRPNALVRSLADLVCTGSAGTGYERLFPPAADPPGEGPHWPGLNTGEGRDMVFHALRGMLGGPDPRGVVLTIDDFHRADVASIEMIEQLVHRPVEGPLLVVIAQRPRQASPRTRGVLAHGVELGTVSRVELRPLTPAQSAELAGLPPGDPRARRLHRESTGVPLYLMALAGELRDGRIPEHLATLIMDEIGQLGPCESLIVAAAAVLDEDWDLETLSAVAEVRPERTREALTTLTERDLLRPAGHSPTYTFRHPLVRRIVHTTTGRAWQVAAHRRATEFLARRGAPAGRRA